MNASSFDIREGQLVRYFHDRPEDAADVIDRAACLKLLGFEETQTGGNCTALMLTRADRCYLLITSPADAIVPAEDEPASVGAYEENGDPDRDSAFGGEYGDVIYETESFPLASNEVLYERVIDWLGQPSRSSVERAYMGESYGGTI